MRKWKYLNDTHREQPFYLIQYKNDWLAAAGPELW